MTWETTLQEAFANNANKVVRKDQFEACFDMQFGFSMTDEEQDLMQGIKIHVTEVISAEAYKKEIDALYTNVGDGTMGTYADLSKLELYEHARYIEYSQDYESFLPSLPENIAEKFATAVECALRHSDDHSAKVRSGELEYLGKYRPEFKKA